MSATQPSPESEQSLHALRDVVWTGGATGHARVEARLMDAHSQQVSRQSVHRGVIGFIARHRLAAAMLGLILCAGGAIAGSYYFHRLYSITITDDQGNVVSAPRILVAPGQKASITIGNADDPDNMLKIEVDENGNVISNRDDVIVDVEVEEVDASASDAPRPPQTNSDNR